MKIVDLTHTFTEDMPVYPGDPKATLEQVAFIEKDTFNVCLFARWALLIFVSKSVYIEMNYEVRIMN